MPTKESFSLVLSKQNGREVAPNGHVIIQSGTPLTRLNYFDGKFLRASDLKSEQDYLRQLVAHSNQTGGPGVAYGFDLTRGDDDTIHIGAGLAIDGSGRVLLLPQGTSIKVNELIDKSRNVHPISNKSSVRTEGKFEECELASSTQPDEVTQSSDVYFIEIAAADALCGEEDVYGKLCEEACATSTDRPFAVEGIIVRAVPRTVALINSKAIALTQTHWRSRVAAGFFAAERRVTPSLISGAGLSQDTWCLGADAAGGNGVPIGVIGRPGSTTVFLDAWIARRERIDSPARCYWQWRMMMRPLNVFLAQILQFQCQLHDLLGETSKPRGEVDPCPGVSDALKEATEAFAEIDEYLRNTAQRLAEMKIADQTTNFKGGLPRIAGLTEKLGKVREGLSTVRQDRFLITGGIVELPSAGYLPVVPGAAITINQQVRRLIGEGVDLRFCVVRPDYVAHALEEAQHMERISLLQGLDDSGNKPQVDILVPDGEIIEEKPVDQGAYEATIEISPEYAEKFMWTIGEVGDTSQRVADILSALDEMNLTLSFNGAARHEASPNGHNFYAALLLDDSFVEKMLVALFRPSIKDSGGPGRPGSGTPIDEAKTIPGIEDAAKNLDDRGGNAKIRDRRVLSRFKTAGDQIRQLDDGIREKREPIDAEVDVEAPPPASGEPALPAGLWLEATCDPDPRTIERNQALRITGRFVLGSVIRFGGVIPACLDVHFTVDAVVDAAVRSNGGGFINCQAAVFGSIIAMLRGSKESDSRSVNLELGIRWDAAGRTTIQIHDPEADYTIDFRGSWSGSGSGLKGVLNAERDESIKIGVRANSDVVKPDNAQHVRATRALKTISRALKSVSFLTGASARLFPPPPKPTEELIVRGTRDWVLFHRRRTRKCQLDVVPPPPAPSRRYGIALINLASRDQLGEVRKAVKSNSAAAGDFLSKLGVKKVDIVEFGGGSAALISSAEDIRTGWRAQGAGKVLEYGAIASIGAAAEDDDTLAQDRLSQIEMVVSPVSRAAENADFEILPTLPDVLRVPGTDGTIVMITAQPAAVPATTCHTVYRAENEDVLKEIRKNISAGKMTNALERLELLGNVQFERDQVAVSDARSLKEVIARWTAAPGSNLWQAVVVFQASRTAADEARFKEQARSIGNKIRAEISEGTPEPEPAFEITPAAMPTQCPAFTILTPSKSAAPASVCHTVYRARSSQMFERAATILEEMKQGQILDTTKERDIQERVVHQSELILLGDVLFENHTDRVSDAGLFEGLKTEWSKHGGDKVGRELVVFQATLRDDGSQHAQAKAIAAKLNGAPITESQIRTVAVSDKAVMPTSCPAFTILVAEVRTVCISVYLTGNRKFYLDAVHDLDSVADNEKLQETLILRHNLNPVGDVSFEPGTANVIEQSMTLMLEDWRKLHGDNLIFATLVARKDLSAAERAELMDQANIIRNRIGPAPGGDTSINLVQLGDLPTFPTSCRAFLFILSKLSSQ